MVGLEAAASLCAHLNERLFRAENNKHIQTRINNILIINTDWQIKANIAYFYIVTLYPLAPIVDYNMGIFLLLVVSRYTAKT